MRTFRIRHTTVLIGRVIDARDTRAYRHLGTRSSGVAMDLYRLTGRYGVLIVTTR